MEIRKRGVGILVGVKLVRVEEYKYLGLMVKAGLNCGFEDYGGQNGWMQTEYLVW